MTALLWSRDFPNRCCCDGAYRPQLNAKGVLVKSKEPAWKMKEQTRDPGCLQERFRVLSKVYPVRYQHHKRSDGSGAGYPDCHCWVPVRPGGGGSAYVELKRMGQNPTEVQVEVMASLQDAGHLVYLARPCCLLVGALDELLADLAGVKCRYVGGDRLGPVFPITPAAARPAVHAEPAAPAGRRRPVYRQPPLPGRDPVPFGPAVAVEVPQPATSSARDAMPALEAWLRAAGFSPYDVPYPIRLVTYGRDLHVQCRIGLARPGGDMRVWRAGTPASDFPDDLLDPLGARTILCSSSAAAAERITGATAPATT